jgi:hypothetical protein
VDIHALRAHGELQAWEKAETQGVAEDHMEGAPSGDKLAVAPKLRVLAAEARAAKR